MKEFWFFLKIYLLAGYYKLARKRVPLNVGLFLTNRCNLRCYYCFGDYRHRQENDFSTAEILSLLDQLKAAGCRYLVLTGGECLLRDDIGQVIRRAKELKLHVCVMTNGLLVKKRLDDIAAADIINISIDGREEVTDFNRGKGVFEKALEAVDACRARGLHVKIGALLTQKTEAEDIAFLASLGKEKGVGVYFATHIQTEYQDEEQTDKYRFLVADRAAMQRHFDLILQYAKQGYPLEYSPLANAFVLDWPFSYAKVRATRAELPAGYTPPPCVHGDFYALIDADGFLYPCINCWGEDRRLNVKDLGFQTAWEQLRRPEDGMCYACHNPGEIQVNLLYSLRLKYLWSFAKQRLRLGRD